MPVARGLFVRQGVLPERDAWPHADCYHERRSRYLSDFLRPTAAPVADSIPARIIPFEDLEEGQVYYGKIVGIIAKSAFVEIGVRHKGTVVNGALFISDIADCYVSDIHDFVQEGDVVKVVVTYIDPRRRSSGSP